MPGKAVPEMTNNVLGRTLNFIHSLTPLCAEPKPFCLMASLHLRHRRDTTVES